MYITQVTTPLILQSSSMNIGSLDLSCLEVKCLDAVGKHEGKEDSEGNQNSSNWPHEIQSVPEMFLDILIDGSRIRPGNRNWGCYISIL